MKYLFLLWLFWQASPSLGLTANEVWYEFHPGFYRVWLNYTIPALKEYREAYADFRKKRDAELFYWQLIRGGEFFLSHEGKVQFIQNPKKPEPW